MHLILPPKRFEDDGDPRFDSIRHKAWFAKLSERRRKVPILRMCYRSRSKGANGETQAKLCEYWGIDPREFRDYVAYVDGISKFDGGDEVLAKERRELVGLLDQAYSAYCATIGVANFGYFIEEYAPKWGIDARKARELWEVDPKLYPTNYPWAPAQD